MNTPLISVIVPIYNVETYLSRCVDSILAQSYSNLEVILVDDGSPDRCGEICDEYAARYGNVKVVHRKNGGLSAARNSGIDIATGEYLTFVDSDDWILPRHIELLYKHIQETNTRLVVCQFQKVGSEQDVVAEEDARCEVMDKLTVMEICLTQFKWWAAWDKLFHRSLFQSIRFPKGRTNEDYAIIFQIYDKCERIAIGSEHTYCYFTREGSITTSPLNIRKFDQIINGEEVLVFMRQRYPSLVQPAESILVTSCLKLLMDIVSEGTDEYDSWRKRMIAIVRKSCKQWLHNPFVSAKQKVLLLPLCFSYNLFVLMSRLYQKICR